MRRCSLTTLAIAVTFVISLVVAAGAQAVVVKVNGNEYGVSLVPGARQPGSTTAGYLGSAGIPIVTSTGSCADPAAGAEPDILGAGSWPLSAPVQPICWHHGPVMNANETFTLTWEGQAPNTYWSSSKDYVQSFLSDVASASGSLTSPYADTTQYWDGSSVEDRAADSSVFGGGCDDNGTAKCRFGSITGSGTGNPLPSSSHCPVSGDNIWGGAAGAGAPETIPNNLCVTASDIQHEVTSLVDNDGLIKYAKPGHTPLVAVLTPPGVVACLDPAGTLCSVNGQLAPPLPSVTTAAATGNPPVGTIPAGTYHVVVTYETSGGETVPSGSTTITTTGSDSTITISSPPAHTGVTGWYAYVASADGSIFVRQGGLQTIGVDDTLNSLTHSGVTPPAGGASFCSYHAQVTDPQSGKPISYVVQPWTPFTSCDEPDIPPLPAEGFTPAQLEKFAGQSLASPLSQSEIATIVNPQLNGWFGLDGLEIDDQNSCQPLGNGLDTFTFGNSGDGPYYLQRESNNAAVVDSDPYTYNGCTPDDVLAPAFVAPSAINLGDTIDLDGSATSSSLAIPNANYEWNFGDGAGGTGPSVEHTYVKAGNYTTTLTVTDRGGNQAALSQVIQVLGASGLPGPSPKPGTSGGLQVHLQIMPQGLKAMLRHGVAVRVGSNEAAAGIASVSISRATAKRAHIKGGGPAIVIGRGTLSHLTAGTVELHLRLSRAMTKKLGHLHRVTLTVRLALVDKSGDKLAIDAAGRY